jgi:hypothetical protein
MSRSNKNKSLQQIDELFLNIIKDFSQKISETISDSAGSLVDISSNYISKQSKDALSDFQKLYFADAELSQFKEDINRGIDDIVFGIQAGKSATNSEECGNVEDDELTARRTSLAAIQRDLEKIITSNKETKDMVLPILESMQFEEILCKSLNESVAMWQLVIENLNDKGDLAQEFAENQLLPLIQQKDERQLFFEYVLQREFDEDHVQDTYGDNVVNGD